MAMFSIAQTKTRGGALMAIIGVSVLIGVLLSALILHGYYQRLLVERLVISQDNKADARSAMLLLLSRKQAPYEWKNTSIWGGEPDSVATCVNPWGGYEMAFVSAKRRNIRDTLAAITGAVPDTNFRSSLYIAENDRPVSVIGTTAVQGDVQLPRSGIRKVYLDGNLPATGNIFSGTISNSRAALPAPEKEALARITDYLGGTFPASYNQKDWSELDNYSDSPFRDPPVVFKSSNPYTLRQSLSGPLILYSSKSIEVASGVVLKGVILVSPYIKTGNHITGHFQAIASDSLVLGDRNNITMPSLLILLRSVENPNSKPPFIKVGSENILCASMLAITGAGLKLKPGIEIGSGNKMMGLYYSTGSVNTQSTLYGKLYVQSLLYKGQQGSYVNYLVNLKINLLPEPFVFPLLFSSSKKQIISWY